MMQHKKIIVCGATGNQGGAVAAALLRTGRWPVTALTRDPGSAAALSLAELGATVVMADLQDVSSLQRAFSGAGGVFAITQPWSYERGVFDSRAEDRQARNIIWACRQAGVAQVVFSSVLNMGRNDSGVPWIDNKHVFEGVFRTYFPDGIIIRPSLYLDNLGTPLLEIKGNVVKGRFGTDHKVPYVALKDIGNAVADIFEDPERYRGKDLNLAGELLTGREIAESLSSVSGRKVFRYRATNEVLLRLFRPAFFRMRRYFEMQGRLLESPVLVKDEELLFFSGRLHGYIAENAAKLFPSGL